MDENVFGFDVSVDDVVVVHELYGVADVFGEVFSFLLNEASFFFEVVVEVASGAVLEYEVDVCVIVKEGVELHYVGVVEVALYFDLSDQLADEARICGKEVFGYFFEGADEVGEDVAELVANYRAR